MQALRRWGLDWSILEGWCRHPSGRGRAFALGTGSLRSSFLSCRRSAHRLLWRSCALSGAGGGEVFRSCVSDSVQVVQEAALVLGKPVSL